MTPRAAAVALLAAAVALRAGGAGWGLPWQLHVDEAAFNLHAAVGVEHAWRKDGWPRQRIMTYGALPTYAFLGLRRALYGEGPSLRALPASAGPESFLRTAYSFDPSRNETYPWPALTRAARLGSAALHAAAAWLSYLAARRLYGPWWALLALALAAGCPGLVQNAHYATPEAFLTLGAASYLLALVALAQGGRWPAHLLAGASLLVISSSKLSGASLALLWPLAAAAARPGPSWRLRLGGALRSGWLWGSLLGCVAAWWLLHPTAYRAPEAYFSADTPFSFPWQLRAYRRGAALPDWAFFFEDKPFWYFATHTLGDAMGLGAQVAGLLGLAATALVGPAAARLPAATAALLLLPLVGSPIHTIRYVVPALPALCLCAAGGARLLWTRLAPGPARVAALAASAALGAATLLLGAAMLRVYLRPDNRVAAARWLRERAGPRDAIAVEDHPFYAPVLDRSTAYDLPTPPVRLLRLGQHLPHRADALRASPDLRFLVLDGWKMRLLGVPSFERAHPEQAALYRAVRDLGAPPGFRLVARFDEGPGLPGWRRDESRSEILHVAFDHIPLLVFERDGER